MFEGAIGTAILSPPFEPPDPLPLATKAAQVKIEMDTEAWSGLHSLFLSAWFMIKFAE